MENDANTAGANVSQAVSKELMIYGILTNKILVGATVIGFSRSGNYLNKEFFDEQLHVFSVLDVVFDDIEEMIKNHVKNLTQLKTIFHQIKEIGLNQILFVMKILEYPGEDVEKIATATDLFLIILQGNLAFQSQKRDTTFSKLLKNEEKDLMKTVFQLCKENLQNEQKQAGVINGIVIDEEYWVPEVSNQIVDEDNSFIKRTLKFFKQNRHNKSDKPKKNGDIVAVAGTTSRNKEDRVPDASGIKIPLSFLKRAGIFEIPPTSFNQMNLTAQHPSFVEFFASVGIFLNSDMKGSLQIIFYIF